ncbi:MAG: hypothetical protein ACE5IL_00655 [Myxococcota bacterium]
MTHHSLLELAEDRQVRQASGFRKMAAELKGERLAELYEAQRQSAPEREHYLGTPPHAVRSVPKAPREEHLALALVNWCGVELRALELPGGDPVCWLDARVALEPEGTRSGIGPLDLLGVGPGDRLVVAELKFIPPSASRGATGETPLRALLQSLAWAAIVEARLEPLRAEVAERIGRPVSKEPPLAIVLGNSRYWELCRKREAQKGAAWICELERLAEEFQAACGREARYAGVALEGDPGWEYPDRQPLPTSQPELRPAWEKGAGQLKPRPRAGRPVPVDEVIEADPNRPTRVYSLEEVYSIGDSIQHATLGRGVVQRVMGPKKIQVRFADETHNRLLVQGRER